jgi:rod shape-determining protein MreD
MIYCFHIATSLCLVILQTTILPYLSIFENFYDLLAPFIIYLGLFRPARESIPVIIFIGFIMDCLTGGPFWLYSITYLWLFIGVRWIIKFLHVGNIVLWPFVLAIGVTIENLMVWGIVVLFEQAARYPENAVSNVVGQVIWVIFTGPFLLVIFHQTHKGWDKWLTKLSGEKNGISG